MGVQLAAAVSIQLIPLESALCSGGRMCWRNPAMARGLSHGGRAGLRPQVNWHGRWLPAGTGRTAVGWRGGGGRGGQGGQGQDKGESFRTADSGNMPCRWPTVQQKGAGRLASGFCVTVTHGEAVHDGRGMFPGRWKWMTIGSRVDDICF